VSVDEFEKTALGALNSTLRWAKNERANREAQIESLRGSIKRLQEERTSDDAFILNLEAAIAQLED
jgi:peptidoglycan hydrolase CwlO-like protein